MLLRVPGLLHVLQLQMCKLAKLHRALLWTGDQCLALLMMSHMLDRGMMGLKFGSCQT